MSTHRGIKDLKGRDPVGVVLSIGKKDKQRGFPIEKDRFHLVNPREVSIDGKGVRLAHPMFEAFNAAPAEQRKVMRGNLVHAKEAECFEFSLKAQVLNKNAHPDMRPCCVGDGVRATRWTGPGAEDFTEIECPHDRCPFRMGKPPQCKPWMRFLFRLRWKEGSPLPTPLAKFTSAAWNTTANFKGFFEFLHESARNLGLEHYTLFGYPFTLSLADQTKRSEKTRFPVVTISPEMDPIEFFKMQAATRRELADMPAPVALPDPEMQETHLLYEDVRGVSRGEAEFPTQHTPEAEIVQDAPPVASAQPLCDGSGLFLENGEVRDCPGCPKCEGGA